MPDVAGAPLFITVHLPLPLTFAINPATVYRTRSPRGKDAAHPPPTSSFRSFARTAAPPTPAAVPRIM
ncbi:MAG: hypothetical protein PWQ69_1152 [Methanomicrobiaceae archaeon]|nr:hypothetical protein [Methanomicrobiaceae archaeon]